MPDKIVHKIHLDRYAPMPAQIQLGTAESYGVEQIAVVAGAGWDGLDIVAVYHPPKAAEPVRVLVPSDGLSDVPPEATASAGRGALVIAGMADGVQIASCNIAYMVIAQAGTDGTPTPDAPVPIVSAGDGGTIAVTLSDGNGKTQTLTLPTPTGLPGIPVTSGGNYTDPQGQQWVCDEVDLERGVKVQKIASFVINAKNANNFFVTNDFSKITVTTNARLSTPQKTNRNHRSDRCVLCEALPWRKIVWASPVSAINFVEDNSVDLAIENSYLGLSEASTIAERKTALVKYFTDNPCQVVYRIATPVETPLTPAELTAYKALTAYGPDTVVQASDGAGIKLDYQRDVNLVVKNLEDAIASMTTT